MGVYQKICYKVEDFFVKTMTKNQDEHIVREKVASYRTKKSDNLLQQQEEKKRNAEEQKRLRFLQQQEKERVKQEKEAEEKRDIENLIFQVMDSKQYSAYEFNEMKRNKAFFNSLLTNVFETNEKALTFIHCEYDKSKNKEIKGYLIPTNKRILFLNKDLTFMDKFRYQTVINVNWFKDGLLEKGLKIQYGKRKLEFDEIFDQNQMQRVGDIILSKSIKKVYHN